MNYNYALLAIIGLCIVASFIKISSLKTETEKMQAVAIIDEYINQSKNKGKPEEDFFANKEEVNSNSQKSAQETSRIIQDGSKISTAFDRYGNKTETRCFNSHPRLNCVMVSTSADGQRRVFVYGSNGDVKGLPENMLDRVATASADEIADAAGIFIMPQRIAPPVYSQTNKIEKPAARQNLPNEQSIVQNQTTNPEKSGEIQEANSTINNREKPASAREEPSPKVEKDTSTISPKPEER